jgi:hypothetical protein
MLVLNKDGRVKYVMEGNLTIAIEDSSSEGWLTATLLDGPAYITAQGKTDNEAVNNLMTAFASWQNINAIEQNEEM